jgi:hypothetical protein
MLIHSTQLAAIAAGTLAYVACDWCGQHSAVVPAGSRVECPHCRNICDEAGGGYDFGFESEGCRRFGLSYQIESGDFQSGY